MSRSRGLARIFGTVIAGGVLGAVSASASAAADFPGGDGPLPVPENFYGGVLAENANPGGSLPGSNDYDCEPSAEHPNPVILLHDLGATRQSNWATFVPALKNEGYCVYSLTYGAVPGIGSSSAEFGTTPLGGFAPLEDSAAELADFVDGVLNAPGTRRGADTGKVDIVGHAEGALVAGYYTKVLGGAVHVDNLVALAPTWKGVGGDVLGQADFPPRLREALRGEIPYFLQVFGDSDFIRTLNAGGSPYAPGVAYTNILTRYNWGIDYTSGLVPAPNATNIVLQDGCDTDYSEHDGIGASPRALQYTLNALDPEHAEPVPCRTILPFAGTAVP